MGTFGRPLFCLQHNIGKLLFSLQIKYEHFFTLKKGHTCDGEWNEDA